MPCGSMSVHTLIQANGPLQRFCSLWLRTPSYVIKMQQQVNTADGYPCNSDFKLFVCITDEYKI